ncbi:MAG: DUF1501 domain-containing protein [Planctomycetota bacterium]
MPRDKRRLRPTTRREMLLQCANGFGALALCGLWSEKGFGRVLQDETALAAPHHAPRARSVIFLYMDGGPSQIDTFDPKPRLDAEDGQPIGMKIPKTQFDNVGTVMRSPWKFRRYGESGLPVSELFTHVASCADELAIIRSMTSNFSEHTGANYFLHTGLGQAGRPSQGAWIDYGLGSESQNLPGFVVLNGGLIPPGGVENFGSGFLPAAHQASILLPSDPPVANIVPKEKTPADQIRKLELMQELDRGLLGRIGPVDAVEGAIANYELAFRMQSAVPELTDSSGETEATKRLYGFDAEYEPTRIYARQCLLARRLVERGVRFIELTCPNIGGDRWDQHDNLARDHERNARAVDQPIAGLLKDLRSRGMLDSTLVVWGGEFGRTPMAQGSKGRDHNPYGFTMWLAGGGVKGGTIHGATDEYGYYAIEGKQTIHDLHATMLHLLGIDHKRLTYRFSGRDMRLTDVHGELIEPILA